MNTEMNSGLAKLLNWARRNTLGDLLTRTRERFPEKFAIAYRGTRLTYAELDDMVNQTAHGFLADGMQIGDMVAVLSKNSLDFVIVNFALARVGAVMIPLNYMLTTQDIEYILNHAGVSGLLAAREYANVLDEAAGKLDIRFRYLMDEPLYQTMPEELNN